MKLLSPVHFHAGNKGILQIPKLPDFSVSFMWKAPGYSGELPWKRMCGICAGKAMRDAGTKTSPVQIRQIQQDWMKTCVRIPSAYPPVCTIFACSDQCVAAPGSQFTHSVANRVPRNWGVVEPLANLLVSTSVLSGMFGSWSPR